MKLSRIRIHNFRAILDQEITLKGYSLLVGPNNAGKSSFIDAVRAFYEKDGFKFKPDSDFPYMPADDQESWVELHFSLTDPEWESLADAYKAASKELRVRKYFQTAGKTADGKPAAGSIFGYTSDGSISDDPFYGAKNVQSGKFGDLVYIPAISRVDEHAKLSGPSALRDLLTEIMSDVVAGGEAHRAFNASVRSFSESIRNEKTSDDRSLSGFESELNLLLDPWETEFRLSFPTPSAAQIIKTMLEWELRDQFHGKSQPIDNFGSGFQRHFIYSLIQLGARYVGKKETKKTKDFTPSLRLVLFEEPEAFLHPPQQEVLARNLMTVASTDSWQVLCATHSPQFVSRNADDIPSIVRLRRSGGRVASFQIADDDWAAIVDANQAAVSIAAKYKGMARTLQTDDTKAEMEAVKYLLWLDPDRCSMFFANHVLLVEGPTEVALINRLVGAKRIQNADCGLHVVDCLGKYNIHRFMNLLGHLGIPHSVIHDDDDSKDEHAEFNQLIQDSRHPALTLAIEPIHGDLEKMLGVPPAKADHRKPQHLLYLYETGQIDSGNVDAFCQLVQSCLPSKPTPELATAASQAVGT